MRFGHSLAHTKGKREEKNRQLQLFKKEKEEMKTYSQHVFVCLQTKRKRAVGNKRHVRVIGITLSTALFSLSCSFRSNTKPNLHPNPTVTIELSNVFFLVGLARTVHRLAFLLYAATKAPAKKFQFSSFSFWKMKTASGSDGKRRLPPALPAANDMWMWAGAASERLQASRACDKKPLRNHENSARGRATT